LPQGGSSTGGSLSGLLADASDPNVVTDVPTLEGKTLEAAMAGGGELSTTERDVLDELSGALLRGDIIHVIELLKVAVAPGIVTGSGISNVLIGGAVAAGYIGTGGAGAILAGGVLIGIGGFQIDAGLMMSNQILGTRFSLGPLSRGTNE
jgi:hypothetical protein